MTVVSAAVRVEDRCAGGHGMAGRPDELLRIARLAAKACKAPIALLSLVDSSGGACNVAVGLAPEERALATALSDATALSQRPFLLSEPVGQPRMFLAKAPPISVSLGVPLRAEHPWVSGSLCVMDRAGRPDFGLGMVDLLRDLGDLALQHQQLLHRLCTDPLTGAASRGHFFEVLEAEIGRCGHGGQPLGLLLADIDHFKAVNDRHGHRAGDAVLRGLVARLANNLGDGEIVGRLGGEEFAILLPGARAEQVPTIARRLRQAVSAAPFKTEKGPVSITLSIGAAGWCAGMTGEADAFGDLLEQADAALYRAKSTGRNRVCTSCGPTSLWPRHMRARPCTGRRAGSTVI